LYPFELSTVFAHGFRWAPRPIFQSYSAYDPRLDGLNVAHLEGVNVPQHVFFQVQPIDDRLPALEDAGSWPVLLSRYKIVGYNGAELHMEQVDAGHSKPVFGEQVTRLAARIGSPVQIPKEDGLRWAEIDLTPTFFGRLALFVLKIPEVQVTLTLDDGRVIHHRYIPSMGQRGFLLSPYIQTTDDFALLAAGVYQLNIVRSIQFDTPAVGMWHRQFNVRLRRLETEAQLGARKFVLVQPSEPPSTAANAVTDRGVLCHLDFVNDLPATAPESPISAQNALKLEGWTVISARDGIAPDEVWIALTSGDGKRRFYHANQESRPDVKAYFGHPNMKDPGFVANVDLAGLSGVQKLDIYEMSGSIAFDCSSNWSVDIVPTSR